MNKLLERQAFRELMRQPDEKVNDFVSRLKRWGGRGAMHVGFGEALEESLVEQLRRGLTKDRMGAKLASIPNSQGG